MRRQTDCASPALGRLVHNGVSPADQSNDQAYDHAYGANSVVTDGKIIGAYPDWNIPTQLLRQGPLDAD